MILSKYDFYIIIIFLFLTFGILGGAFQPIRIISIILFLYYSPLIINNLKQNKSQFYFVSFLGIYSFFSIFLYIENIKESFISFIYILINLIFYSVFITFYKESNLKFKSIVIGVYVFLTISLSYSIYEITTGNHLSTNLDHGIESLMNRSYSSFSFGNYNTYVMILIMMLPILIYSIINYNIKNKIYSLILFFLASYVIIINGSRTGAVLLLLTLGLFLLNRSKNFVYGLISKIVVLGLGFSLLIQNMNVFDTLFLRLSNSGFESAGRVENLTLPINGLISNVFLGFGIGNYQFYMLENYPNKLILAPHNFFGEIFYELGLFGLILILYNLYSSTVLAIKRNDKFIFFTFLLIFPFFCMINSGYLMGVYVWLYLAIMTSVAYFGVKDVR